MKEEKFFFNKVDLFILKKTLSSSLMILINKWNQATLLGLLKMDYETYLYGENLCFLLNLISYMFKDEELILDKELLKKWKSLAKMYDEREDRLIK